MNSLSAGWIYVLVLDARCMQVCFITLTYVVCFCIYDFFIYKNKTFKHEPPLYIYHKLIYRVQKPHFFGSFLGGQTTIQVSRRERTPHWRTPRWASLYCMCELHREILILCFCVFLMPWCVFMDKNTPACFWYQIQAYFDKAGFWCVFIRVFLWCVPLYLAVEWRYGAIFRGYRL